MTITLTNGDTVFEIANGLDRNARVAEDWRPSMHQDTPDAVRARAAYPTGFPERAVRWIEFKLPVMFPECATTEESIMQSMMIPAQCPKGGVLKVTHLGNRVSFSQAWLKGEIACENINIRNLFIFPVKAVNPSAHYMVIDELGDVMLDEDGTELEY